MIESRNAFTFLSAMVTIKGKNKPMRLKKVLNNMPIES